VVSGAARTRCSGNDVRVLEETEAEAGCHKVVGACMNKDDLIFQIFWVFVSWLIVRWFYLQGDEDVL